jgi:hypothetical protein
MDVGRINTADAVAAILGAFMARCLQLRFDRRLIVVDAVWKIRVVSFCSVVVYRDAFKKAESPQNRVLIARTTRK